jgi:hypothetical protein
LARGAKRVILQETTNPWPLDGKALLG